MDRKARFLYTALFVFLAVFIVFFPVRKYFDELCRINTYFPSKSVPATADIGGAEEVWIEIPATAKTEVGKIHALWFSQPDKNAPSLLYLHGNSGNIYTDMNRIRAVHDAGFAVLAIDYRGYGKSSGGLPDEEELYADALAGWAKLAFLAPYSSRRIVYGYSLGGAVAVWLAQAVNDVDGLVLEGTFTSLCDVAQTTCFRFFLPLSCMLTQQYPSVERIDKIKTPKLFIHGELDKTVPAGLGLRLYEAAAEPKIWLYVKGGSHNDAYQKAGREWVSALQEIGGL